MSQLPKIIWAENDMPNFEPQCGVWFDSASVEHSSAEIKRYIRADSDEIKALLEASKDALKYVTNGKDAHALRYAIRRWEALNK